MSSESNTFQINIDVKVHIPTDNVYSVNRRAGTSQQKLERFEANNYHERKYQCRVTGKVWGRPGDLEHYISPGNLVGMKES